MLTPVMPRRSRPVRFCSFRLVPLDDDRRVLSADAITNEKLRPAATNDVR